MHTNRNLTNHARQFRRAVKADLADRELSVTRLAEQIGRSRNAVSRAINRGEFPAVQNKIREALGV